jgi:hypothetical protein
LWWDESFEWWDESFEWWFESFESYCGSQDERQVGTFGLGSGFALVKESRTPFG